MLMIILSHGYYDFSAGVSFFEISQGLGSLG
jgi:metal-dependent hydrolase (beta-lactamase superfamily II)